MSYHRIDFESISWESPIQGMRCKVKRGEGKQLRLVEYYPEMKPHWCEKGHLGYMLEGEFEIEFDAETCRYAPGDGIVIPAGKAHRHQGRVLSEVVRVIFVEEV
ncbi:MAG: cupin domain-containing protein [Candidatus Krumholzibacteriota bacterium]|nr:cupin domain-containing protein [Candidatus Krumholzibacteriota bacterium]